MASTQDLKDAAVAEAQAHAAAIAAKDQTIAERDATIVDLQNQLANAPTPQALDEVKAAIEGIVP